ncbi:CBS domain-containing protein [Clostridium fermenticellae]|uniref:CBS domain-containing protein n=1 Tax=Clostridium fermenticellae TaxID=2068654 RepID=A0A386H3S5_9CLOT|nr:CBS domain-containing protein [Clostridium fermenticellae]AYD40379.1 CBS domain-containing protein [Clostridium fermenticellae]
MISDIISCDIIKLKPDEDLKRVLSIMDNNNINGAPVVDEDGKLVGMIVKADIYRFLMDDGHYDTCPVDWVMTKNVITVSKYESINAAAHKILDNEIVAIPVLDGDSVVGVVSIEDVLKYYLNENV